MADISESLFKAIDTIVNKRLQAINFDNTDIYSITDASKAEFGEYKVTDGSVTFTAYSTNTDYKENEAVYVTIPNNDFNQQKLIIGKYTANSDTPFVFTNPTSTMIDITGNIIYGEIQEAGLTANSPNNGEDTKHNPYPYSEYTEENEEEVILWQLDCQDKNYIGFERLGIKGDFKSWLNEFDCIKGHYGLKLQLQCINNDTYSNKTIYELIKKKIDTDWNWVVNTSNIINEIEEDISELSEEEQKQAVRNYIDTKLNSLYKYYYFLLDTDDMIGDVYNFVSYHRQEQVYDISDIGQITKMELSFYQKAGTFLDMSEEEIDYTDMFDHLLNRNLFTIDPYISLGYDLNNFDGEQALLVTTDSLTYKQADAVDSVTEEGDIYHKKVIHLSWVHEEKNGKIISIETGNEVDGIYEVRWYQRSAGAASPDEWAGVEWKQLTQDSEGNDLGPHAFKYTLIIDQDSYNKPYEQIKAIIIYTPTSGTTTAIRSNILTFTNENDVVNKAAADMGRGLTLRCLDGSEGNYFIYRQDYQLIDSSDGEELRTLQCELYSTEFGLEGEVSEAKSIIWHIPATNTMLKVASGTFGINEFDYSHVDNQDAEEYYGPGGLDILYDPENLPVISQYTTYYDKNGVKHENGKTTGYLYDINNKEIVIIWYGDENSGYAINSYLQYQISDFYAQNSTNNKITCEIEKNNRNYIGDQEFSFGTAGTNGTAYTLVIDMYNVVLGVNEADYTLSNKDTALDSNDPAGSNHYKAFVANLYDTKGQQINIYNSENFSNLQFVWGLGNTDGYKSWFANSVDHLFTNSWIVSKYDTVVNEQDSHNLCITAYSGNKQYRQSTVPNQVLMRYKTDMFNLLFIYCTLKGWGDYDLTAVYPIAIRRYTEQSGAYIKYLHINGPDRICYPTTGYPEFYNNPFHIYTGQFDENHQLISKDIQLDNYDEEINTNGVRWRIFNPWNEDLIYLPRISDNYVLQPLDFYISNIQAYGIQAIIDNTVIWTQPIWTFQNRYFSQALNEWDGKSIEIDDENGTIIARGLAVGKKETGGSNPNSFTGVVLGDWSNSAGGNVSDDMADGTGVYGFRQGAMTYAFKDNGTAFIGGSGKGRILFDGQHSTITSENYNSLGVGLSVDLDDGIIKFNNIKNTAGTNNGTNEENYFITLDASNNNLKETNHALAIGTDTPNFYVQWDGSLYASNADIQGFIHGSTIDIADGAFWVDENGETQISHLGADDATINDLKVNYLKIVEQLGSSGTAIDVYSDFVMNSDILMQGNEIKQAKLVGGTLYNPELHIYLGTTSTTTTVSYRYERVNNYSASIDYYWLSNGSSTYTHAGFLKYWQYDTYSDRMGPGQFYRRYKVSSSSSSSSDSTGAGAKSPIYIHSGGFSGTYDSSTIVGIIGSTGETYDSKPTAGFKMSAGNYGVILKAHGGGILAIGGGTGGNAYMAEATGTSYVQLSGDVARLHGKGWFIDLGTYNDGPLLKNPNNSTVYDLRYAYFA